MRRKMVKIINSFLTSKGYVYKVRNSGGIKYQYNKLIKNAISSAATSQTKTISPPKIKFLFSLITYSNHLLIVI